MLYASGDQKDTAEFFIKKLTNSNKFQEPIVTEVVALEKFWPAEEYHKDYYAKHPNEGYPMAIIKPKIDKIKEKYINILK